MKTEGEQRIATLIDNAPEFACEATTADCTDDTKPTLLIENADPQRTVAAMRDILADRSPLLERAVPVRIVKDRQSGMISARPMTANAIVMIVHELARPTVLRTKEGKTTEHNARVPKPLAEMYLDCHGEWGLPPLSGIASTPLLRADGSMFTTNGYDPATGFWLENVLDVASMVPTRPTHAEAVAALGLIRSTVATFCFADAKMVGKPNSSSTVNLEIAPAHDESAFLIALMTAVCRPSLDLAPGFLIRAPQLSGAGSGKGLLARLICRIAYGREPHAVTGGDDAKELDKRITAELIGGGPVLFLDNLNNLTFKSNLLASAITERPARVRILGKSEMLPLNATAFVVLTGNALTVAEDLARRFIAIELDPGVEDPETRAFSVDIRQTVKENRANLLAAVLTVWRWGRQHPKLRPGLPLGSFDQWARWVRDPLLALGCCDPVERLVNAKQNDGHRQELVAVFRLWHQAHGDKPVTAHSLSQVVKDAMDPHKRGRQFIAAYLAKLAGARVAGFTLTKQAPDSKWSADSYALRFDNAS